MAELNIAQPMRFRVDVKTGLVEQPQRESLMKGDKKANRIIVELVNGSETLDITGVTVKGKFCRPPDLDEIELSGTAEGNLAIVQLTDACYAQSGNYQATVSLLFDDVERTVLFISGTVLRSGSGNAAGDEETGGSGGTGSGLPAGGTAGQVLVKVTAASGDASWKTLTATDVKARPDTWMPTAEEVGALPSTTEIPTVPSALPNPQPIVINGISYDGSEKKEITIQADGGGIAAETDPTVPDWAKQSTKPTYTADEIGALPATGTAADSDKLNGKDASEYALLTDLPTTAADVGALAEGAQAVDSAKLNGNSAEYYATAEQLNALNAAMKIRLLWSNGSGIYSDFAAQDVILSDAIENYSLLIFEYNSAYVALNKISGVYIVSGEDFNMMIVDRSYYRHASHISGTYVHFLDAYNSEGSLVNNRLIPIAIYGLKLGGV